jgi:hypothetical protein
MVEEDQASYQQEVNDRESAMKRGELEKNKATAATFPLRALALKLGWSFSQNNFTAWRKPG